MIVYNYDTDLEVEHSNSDKKSFDSILATESIFSIRQSDKFAASTLIFK